MNKGTPVNIFFDWRIKTSSSMCENTGAGRSLSQSQARSFFFNLSSPISDYILFNVSHEAWAVLRWARRRSCCWYLGGWDVWPNRRGVFRSGFSVAHDSFESWGPVELTYDRILPNTGNSQLGIRNRTHPSLSASFVWKRNTYTFLSSLHPFSEE